MNRLSRYIDKKTEAAPLAAFRFLFGILMLISLVRFWYNGWIEKLYILPEFHFSYHGFEWVKPLGTWTYVLFAVAMVSSICISLGYRYRLSMLVFFLSFSYIELMDKTTYLNHYYFISILSFLMIFLPAASYFSVDAYLDERRRHQYIPAWSLDAVKLLLAIVYFYAGLAKLNHDWLFEAMPLKIWLPSAYGVPFIGSLMQEEWIHYAFSWGGAIYDLSIAFLLLWKKTRKWAFLAVLFFHIMTRILFPIGMFPFIMITATLIYFGPEFHKGMIKTISKPFSLDVGIFNNGKIWSLQGTKEKITLSIIMLFFTIQLLFPFRFILYPGKLFWTEQGYRFSWRVMLMEKAGYANFKILDGQTGRYFYVNNRDFLSSFQEKQMATQADFILEYAHFLRDHFSSQGHQNIEIYVESYVALNGERSKPFIDPDQDLCKLKKSLSHKSWILPYND